MFPAFGRYFTSVLQVITGEMFLCLSSGETGLLAKKYLEQCCRPSALILQVCYKFTYMIHSKTYAYAHDPDVAIVCFLFLIILS